MNDNDHAIALHILETLMNFNGPLSLEELSSTLRSSSTISPCLPHYLVSMDELENLRCFLKNYPSLFCIQDNLVIPVTCAEFGYTESFLNNNNNNSCNYGPVSVSVQYLDPYQINPENIDFATEQLAVRYFKFQLARRKGEQWVSIRSLSGHLSQAKQNIKNFLPNLADFVNLLKRHPDVFVISDDHVSLVEKMTGGHLSSLTPTLPPKSPFLPPTHHSQPGKGRHLKPRFKYRRKTSPSDDTRSLCSNQSYLNATEFEKTYENSSRIDVKFPDLEGDVKVTLPVIEYCAVMLIRRLLFRVGPQGTHPGLILRRLFRAPTIIREVIGWTRIELDEFLSKHQAFFERIPLTLPITSEVIDTMDKKVEGDYLVKIPQDTIRLKVEIFLMDPEKSSDDEKINLSNLSKNFILSNGHSGVINENGSDSGLPNGHYRGSGTNSHFTSTEDINQKSTKTPNEDIVSKKGIIFHVAKLWGIIDLGQHEHVFFDKSIFKNVLDLQKHFQLGETVYFNAIVAPRRSRAKWKATRVWKEDDHVTLRSVVRLNGYKLNMEPLKRCNSIAGGPQALTNDHGNDQNPRHSLDITKNGFVHDDEIFVGANGHADNLSEDEENNRFLGDQDLGLSLLSLADLDNIDKCQEDQEPEEDVVEGAEQRKKLSLLNEDETLDQITNLPAESNNNSQATTITTTHTSSKSSSRKEEEPSQTSSKSIACQTIITGRLNPKYLYKGDLCSLDETYEDPSLSENMIDPALVNKQNPSSVT